MIIDAHSHVHDPLDLHLSALDDAGVDRTVLFPAARTRNGQRTWPPCAVR